MVRKQTFLIHLADEIARHIKGAVELEWPLGDYSTYRAGGKADLAIFPKTISELPIILSILNSAKLSLKVIGGGSNVLVSDQGIRGALICTKELTQITQGKNFLLSAQAGVLSNDVATFALKANLTGVEFLTHLPGTIGGACLMNARAYGGEISQILQEVKVLSHQGEMRDQKVSPEAFSYKQSPFKGQALMIVQATVQLRPAASQTIKRQMDEIISKRLSKREHAFPSCGCVFKNNPAHGMSAGRLIDHCGLKGFRIGDAQVSLDHGNFIFNLGRAKAADIKAVIDHVQGEVFSQTGHKLELELVLMGY